MADLQAIEARIWAMLEPYRDRLEPATIYGIPSLRWPGAKAHDYFAAVKTGKSYVSLYLLVADTFPEALEGASAELLKRRPGRPRSTSRDSTTSWPATWSGSSPDCSSDTRRRTPTAEAIAGLRSRFDSLPFVSRKRDRHAPRGLETVGAALGDHRLERDRMPSIV